MSGVDASIPMGFRPTPNIGPDVAGALQNAQAMWQLDATRKQAQSQNALKSILSSPGAIDASGNPTPDAMSRIMAADPDMGMKFKQNALVQQEHQLQSSVMQTKAFSEKLDLLNETYGPIDARYQDNIKAGMTPEAAKAIAQTELDGANEGLQQGGMFSEAEAAKHPTKFDPVQMRTFFDGSTIVRDRIKAQTEADKERRTENRDDAKFAEEKRYHDIEAGKVSPAAASERDVEAIAADRIAKEEAANGGPLSEARKAAIRQQARIDPKIAEAAQKQETKPAGADHANVEADIRKEHPDWSAGQVALEAKKREKAAAAGPSITDDAATLAAQRVLSGDERATVGMARSATNIAKVTNEIARIAQERGWSGEDVARKVAEFASTVSGERAIGTRSANMEIAANEVKNMAPLALAASAKVNRTQNPTLNSILLAAEKGTGNEDVVRFGLAANSLIYTYSKFLNPTGIPTDADKAKATEILSTAWSKGQFGAAIDQIKKEIASGQAALKTAKQEIGDGISGSKPDARNSTDGADKGGTDKGTAKSDQAGGGPMPIPAALNGMKLDQNRELRQFRDRATGKLYNADGTPVAAKPDPAKPAATAGNTEGNNAAAVSGAIARAKDAIAKGAPRDKVIAKLRAAGIDTGGL